MMINPSIQKEPKYHNGNYHKKQNKQKEEKLNGEKKKLELIRCGKIDQMQ